MPIKVPTFTVTNWYKVKDVLLQGLAAINDQACISLTYLVRESRKTLDETEDVDSLEQQRILTKAHSGPKYNKSIGY